MRARRSCWCPSFLSRKTYASRHCGENQVLVNLLASGVTFGSERTRWCLPSRRCCTTSCVASLTCQRSCSLQELHTATLRQPDLREVNSNSASLSAMESPQLYSQTDPSPQCRHKKSTPPWAWQPRPDGPLSPPSDFLALGRSLLLVPLRARDCQMLLF